MSIEPKIAEFVLSLLAKGYSIEYVDITTLKRIRKCGFTNGENSIAPKIGKIINKIDEIEDKSRELSQDISDLKIDIETAFPET